MLKSENFLIGSDMPWENPAEGITRHIMGYNAQLMMVEVKFVTGAIGYPHHHIHSQSSYVVSGKFEVTINDKKQILSAGDGFFVEPNIVHGVICLEEGILIDAFNPVREDFLTV